MTALNRISGDDYSNKRAHMKQISIFILLFSFLTSCTMHDKKTHADLIVRNGTIYTVDSNFSIAQAMAIADGKILATGTDEEIAEKYASDSVIDLQGKFVYPGFIDPHCHFLNYGVSMHYSNLFGTKSFNAILDTIKKHDPAKTGGWIIGRGWDQNLWDVKEFPDCKKLDELFPDIPVWLIRVDGHAGLANTKALQLAGITPETIIPGGVIKKDGDKCTGLLIDNAMTPMEKILPIKQKEFLEQALLEAQKNCFVVGLTSIHDAGLDPWQINIISEMQQEGKLKMRIYAMALGSDSNLAFYFKNGKIKTPYLNVSAFKFYGDGALGSRGAALLAPYSDDSQNSGLLFYSFDSLQKYAQQIYEHGWQMCTHAIGDAANREVLDVYASVLKGKNDMRWRIEHCQVIDKDDFHKFGDYSIIPSVQTTHATSDMNWADERLGPDRIKYAYAYQDLLKQNGFLANGSDFPIENINPLYGFYAAVSRKDKDGNPVNGFQKENALTREQALKAMTIWAAYAGFEEKEKGSLEKGKVADFVVMGKDIMKAEENKLWDAKILLTYSNGIKIYETK